MKSTLAFLLILLAFQLEWTDPRTLHENTAYEFQYLVCSPCGLSDPDHRQTPPWRSTGEVPGDAGVLETDDDDLTDPHFRLVEIAGWARVDRRGRCCSSVRRPPFADFRPATVGAALRC